MIRIIAIAVAAALVPLAALAEPCPGNPDALGTERVIEVDAKTTPRVGRKHFPTRCRCAPRSWCSPSTTDPGRPPRRKFSTRSSTNACAPRSSCSARTSKRTPKSPGGRWPKATASAITLIRTPLLDHMPLAKAEAEINRGIEEDEFAVYGQRRSEPATPFFRFPGFASNRALLDRMSERGIVVFGADVWASDWLPMAPDQELQLILARIERSAAASCCSTTPRRRPPRCSRPSCASSNGADTASCTWSRPQARAELKASFFAATAEKSCENKPVDRSSR